MYKTFAAVLLLCSCEITPLYNDNNEAIGTISVDIINGRDGQQLRKMLQEGVNDLNISRQNYVMSVTLSVINKNFAEMTDANPQRVEQQYIADIELKNIEKRTVLKKRFITSSSGNVASGHGDVIFSLYGQHNRKILKELSNRIIEGLKVALSYEK